MLRDILEKTGYEHMLKSDSSPEAEARLGNLEELVNAAAEASERGENAAEFLDHAALVADADGVDEQAAVSLLTIHNAKGLEFPNVFLAGMEEGLFPHSRSLTSEAAMEEERRLCYVGMTRAEKRLYLSNARYRRRFGGGQPGSQPALTFPERSAAKPMRKAFVDLWTTPRRSGSLFRTIRSARRRQAQPLYRQDL